MPTYPMHFAKTHLSDLVARAEAGEEVVVARGKTPAVRLVPMRRSLPQRRRGRLKGLIAIGPEFFEPLPDDELRLWSGAGD